MARWIYRPDALICLVWIAFVLAYLSAPLDYVHAPRIVAWSVMASGLLAFCCGSLGVTLLSRKVTPQTAGDVAHLDAIVTVVEVFEITSRSCVAPVPRVTLAKSGRSSKNACHASGKKSPHRL